MLGSPAGPGGPSQRGGLWPLAPAPAPSAASFTADGFGKCGVYSLFPGGPSFGSALYSHARTIGQFTSNHIQQSTTGNPFHHKDSLFSSTGYTFGAPTPPPGSPYSPVPVTQLELFTKGFNSNIIIQQQQQQQQQQQTTSQPSTIDYCLSPKKYQDKQRYDDKCCNLKQQKSCNCNNNNNNNSTNNNNQPPVGTSAKKFVDNNNIMTGCSRTNPIEWNGTTTTNTVNIKKEPGTTIITSPILSTTTTATTTNPCQVAEITTSVSPPVVKLELTSPKNDSTTTTPTISTTSITGGGGVGGGVGYSTNSANIPIGITVARQQRYHQEIIGSPSLPPAGLLTTVNAAAQIKDIARITEIESASAASTATTATTPTTSSGMAASNPTGGIQAGGVTAGGGASLLQCTDERNGLATWSMGGAHSSALATPTLWQYPAPVPMEPMVPLPVPMPPVGFQLVRDPTTGGLLLLPTTGIEPLQQAVVWPSYHQPPSVLLPPLPPPPLQLLSSAAAAAAAASTDYLSSSTTLHQHTQTHSTRLVALTTDNKRKIPLPIPTTTLIKIETDAAATTLDQTTKTLQAVSTISGTNTGTVYTDQNMTPLVTTHVIYQHPTNLILSQPQQQQQQQQETLCRSQATSPVACLTPPPETANIHHQQQQQQQDDEQQLTTTVQDASNQTECNEDDNTNQLKHDLIEQGLVKITNATTTPVPEANEIVAKQVPEPEQVPEITSRQNDEPTTTTTIQTIDECNKQKPDISGLELLSNSIVEFENCRQQQQQQQQQQHEEEKVIKSEPIDYDKDNNLGGLDLLCALAEQRILEENVVDKQHNHRTKERKKEKRKSKKHTDEPKKKKSKHHHHHHHHHEQKSKKRHESTTSDCCCRSSTTSTATTTISTTSTTINGVIEENYRTYKTPESEEEVRKFIQSKTHQEQQQQQQYKQQNCCNKNDWPDMNEMELDMRMKLADLQRQYREKQKELNKLKPKKHDCVKKRTKTRKERTPPPPILDKIDNLPKTTKTTELLKPPTLCPFETTITTTINNNKTTPQKLEPIKQSDRIINDYKRDLMRQRAALEEIESLSSASSPASTPEKCALSSLSSASKKRKVGRPKKLSSPSGYHVAATETIVAKKPKNNFVGYLLAAKEKLQLQSKLYKNSPPRYIDDNSNTIGHKVRSNHDDDDDDDDEDDNVVDEDDDNDDDERKSCKIRPKLKAEATVKLYDEDEEQWESHDDDDGRVEEIEINDDEEDIEDNNNNEVDETIKKHQKIQEESDKIIDITEENKNEDKGVVGVVVDEQIKMQIDEELEQSSTKSIDNRCTLTSEHLEIDKLRVLTAMGGLFYAGHLNAVQPPDVYSITLDGERGNRPHIMSREEILRDAIVEVSPKSTEELPVGTRLCAYWSQQYRCLYPGSVAEPGTPNPVLDSKFVAVEFDDGDSGRIAIEDIRLLPPDYPIIEYDPNPLLSLSKRRRRTSTSVSTEERRQQTPVAPSVQQPPPPPPSIIQQSEKKSDLDLEKENKDINKPDIDSTTTSYKERKRLKKKKKEKLKQKLLLHDDRKKKKKHRCSNSTSSTNSNSSSSGGESVGNGHCKHKKHHKKHRKHKKRHHYVIGKVDTMLPTVVEEEEDEADKEADEDDAKNQTTAIETCNGDGEETNDDDFILNPDDEVTRDDIVEAARSKKSKKIRDRQESCESRSKMSAFLPARQLWSWFGKGYKRPRAKGRARKQFYRTIQRGKEIITVGDSAVFLSTGRPDRPYIGKIEAMWELCGTMVVRVKWFYHPEETVGCPLNLQYPGALFESPHIDENDVQTIAHKCEVLPLKDYKERLGDDPQRYAEIYDNNDIYYLAGYYDPTTTTLKIQPEIPFTPTKNDN